METKESYNHNKQGLKRTLCPVCCNVKPSSDSKFLNMGKIRDIENHMKEDHPDYMKKHNISDTTFRTIEMCAASLRQDKFVAYMWPEYVGVCEEKVEINPTPFDFLALKFTIEHSPYKASMIQDLIERGETKFTQLTATEFINRCLNAKIITYDFFMYSWIGKQS